MYGAKNYGSCDILMGDYWFESFLTEQYIISYGTSFKLIFDMEHSLDPKYELKIMINLFPCDTHVVIGSFGDNYHEIYEICYNIYSKKVIFFIASESTSDTIPGKTYEARCTYFHGNFHSRLIHHPYIIYT